VRYRNEVFADVTVSRRVSYGELPDNVLDVYAPTGDRTVARPALIWIHGGGFSGGKRSEGPLISFTTTFAKLGYVTFSIDYRLLETEPCIGARLTRKACNAAAAAATADARAAVRWVRANAAAYGVDASRIAVAGESAGGIAATGAGLESTTPDESVRAWVSISGGATDTRAVNAGDPPGCLISGTDDTYVPYQKSADTAAAMRAAGVTVELVTLDGEGHVPVDVKDPSLFARTRDFLYDNLDLAHALG
jgi:acetyl esterase/lipase